MKINRTLLKISGEINEHQLEICENLWKTINNQCKLYNYGYHYYYYYYYY